MGGGDARASGRQAKRARLRGCGSFIGEALTDYAANRDRPDIDGTSRLSPHLAFGEISPRQIWHAVSHAAEADSARQRGAAAYIRELYWREFSTHLLFHRPDLPSKPFRAGIRGAALDTAIPPRCAPGRKGAPAIRSSMPGLRQLWAIGWMHNRVRMVAASFLTKHLLIPWQEGEAWFWDTLVDADLANNAASWQWVAGSGADAAPYFRVFNPILQGRKFDAEGELCAPLGAGAWRSCPPNTSTLPGTRPPMCSGAPASRLGKPIPGRSSPMRKAGDRRSRPLTR